tara:strand:+ start:1313 stop:2425 length:1113 start_codon:yes stop_codon:yes gene_type:complete
MIKKLVYITYQTFPAETANSIQTISNIKYFVKNKTNVDLYFPLRERQSDGDINKLKNYYSFNENFNSFGVEHPYPHGKIKFLTSLWFHISHFLWSKKVVKKINKEYEQDTYFITRSDWIALFLAKKNRKIVFECHQTSKIRNLIIKIIKNKKNVKFIFLNNYLNMFYKNPSNGIVLHNAVDSELFENNIEAKQDNSIVFVGNISRFKKTRGLETIIKWFNESEINRKFTIKIIGGPNKSLQVLNEIIKKNNLQNFVKVCGRLNRLETIKEIQKSSIGLLVNSDYNLHSLKYTSPLKYFEYLFGGLKIIAVNFPAHHELPFSENISFFNSEDKNSFIQALNNIEKKKVFNINDLKEITLDIRIKKILKFIE